MLEEGDPTVDPEYRADVTVAGRYTRKVALRHELLYGPGYQGPGSEEVFDALAARLGLRPGLQVLDAGSGLGGDTLRLAEKYRVAVLGLDAAPDMTAICRERLPTSGLSGVQFETGDLRDSVLMSPRAFDVVWTRDCGAFLTPPEKRAVWARFWRTLRPGGRVLVTDYCLGLVPPTPAYAQRMVAWGQHMITFSQYEQLVRQAGFIEVELVDRTVDLLDSMLAAQEALVRHSARFLAELTVTEYEGLQQRWDQKIDHCRSGQLAWLVLTATRPKVGV